MKDSRISPVAMSGDEFKKIGYQLVDAVAHFLETIPEKPVTTGESPKQIQQLLGSDSLPEDGIDAVEIINRSSRLMLEHSLLNGHPKFSHSHF